MRETVHSAAFSGLIAGFLVVVGPSTLAHAASYPASCHEAYGEYAQSMQMQGDIVLDFNMWASRNCRAESTSATADDSAAESALNYKSLQNKWNTNSPSSNSQKITSQSASTGATTSTQQPQSSTPSSYTQTTATNTDQCSLDQDIAQKCCLHPEQCMGSTTNPAANDNASVGMQIFGAIMAAGAQVPSQSATPAGAAQMCGRMKDISTAMGAVSLYFANQCREAVSQCDSACKSKDDVALCEKYSGSQTTYAASAVSSQVGAKILTQCQNLANQQENQFANPDCSTAAAAATPFCQYACNRPNAQNDPTCASIIANMQGSAGQGLNAVGAGSGTVGAGTGNPFANSLPSSTSVGQQTPQMAAIAPVKGSGLDTTSAGGGGARLPGDSVSGGTANSASAAHSAASGLNTHILTGVRTGDGYIAIISRTGSGGFAGARPATTPKSLGQPFNLSAFLPGGAQSKVRLNAFRGLASTYADISPAHVDIFKKISDRFRAVCLRDELYDCSGILRERPAGE